MVNEAYFEYLPAGGHDAGRLVAEGRRSGRRCAPSARPLAWRASASATCSGPPDLVRALGVVRNVFDVSAPAQAAAVASLAEADALLPERIA